MVGHSTEDVVKSVASLFLPDTVSPAQYLETVRRKTHLEADQELMLAVLEYAITCFRVHSKTNKRRGYSVRLMNGSYYKRRAIASFLLTTSARSLA